MRLIALMGALTSRFPPNSGCFFKFNYKTLRRRKDEGSRNVSFKNGAYQRVG